MKKGFTLIEVLLGLFLLGIISTTTLPILTSSLLNISKSKIKLEMNYIGEIAIERIKAFDEDKSLDNYIFDLKVSDIIDDFKKQTNGEVFLHIKEKAENYTLRISKEERSSRLWMIKVDVYHDKEESNLSHVEYKTYILQK